MADVFFMLKAQGADCPIEQKRSQYTQYPIQNAEKDFKQEAQEFKDRYGQDCQQLLEKEMIKQGIPITKSMNDKEFESVVMNIVKKFPEEQQVDMAKDFREHSLTYLELQNCKKDLNQERENNKVTSGSGYVDILLVLSVICTVLMLLGIVLFILV